MTHVVSLSDAITLQRGFDLPTSQRKAGRYPVVAATGIASRHHEAKVKGPGVVIGRSGSIGGGQYIESDFWPLNTTLWVKDFRGNNKKFIYYLLKSIDFSGFNAGAAVPTLNRNHLSAVRVRIPDRDEQDKIADILGTIDEKIELNRRMNETLEQMGQALFRHHFITNPEAKSWGRKPIGQLIDLALGGDWGKEQPDEKCAQKVRVIRGTDMGNIQNGNIGDVPERFVEAKKYETRRLLPGDILIEISGGSNTQPTGRSLFVTQQILDLLGGSVIPASFCRLVRTRSPEWATTLTIFLEYLYSNGKMWDYQNRSTGISNFQYKYFTETATIANAPLEIFGQFHSQAHPLLIKRAQNAQEIQTLTTLRDTLLPRLISGKIQLADKAEYL